MLSSIKKWEPIVHAEIHGRRVKVIRYAFKMIW